MMSPVTEAAPSLAQLVAKELREAWWIYAVVPLALTLLNYDGYGGTSFGLILLVNACATVGIGVSTQTAFVLAERRGFSLAYGLHYPLLVLAGVGVGTELTFVILRALLGVDASHMREGMWVIGGTVAVLVATVSVGYEHLRERARAVELREEQAQRQALQARLDALQSRMNPHFLFNSLNTVAALIEEDQEAAIDAVERLSELLRYTLERSEAQLVPLADELECVREYLALEQLRFGERLRASIELAEPELARCQLPPLSVQPLVENAVKHGVAPSRAPVQVEVRVRASEAGLTIEVRDDGPGPGAAPSRGTGSAHVTLRARLELLYGEAARFEAGPGPERGYLARLELPVQTGPAALAGPSRAGPRRGEDAA